MPQNTVTITVTKREVLGLTGADENERARAENVIFNQLLHHRSWALQPDAPPAPKASDPYENHPNMARWVAEGP